MKFELWILSIFFSYGKNLYDFYCLKLLRERKYFEMCLEDFIFMLKPIKVLS